MALGKQLFTVILLTMILVANSAKQNFNLIFTDVKCTPNNKYIHSHSCTIGRSSEIDTCLNIEAQMKKSIHKVRLDYSVTLDRSNRESVSLFKISNIDGCTSMLKNTSSPLLSIFRDLLVKYGEWPPPCPTTEDYIFKFMGIRLDPTYLPAFLPEAVFRVLIKLQDGSVNVFNLHVSGKVARQRKEKRWLNEGVKH